MRTISLMWVEKIQCNRKCLKMFLMQTPSTASHCFGKKQGQSLKSVTLNLVSTMYTAPPSSACQTYHMCSKPRQNFHVRSMGILFSENADLCLKTLYCHCVFMFCNVYGSVPKTNLKPGHVQQKTATKTSWANFANRKIVNVMLNMHSNAAGAKQCNCSYDEHMVKIKISGKVYGSTKILTTLLSQSRIKNIWHTRL